MDCIRCGQCCIRVPCYWAQLRYGYNPKDYTVCSDLKWEQDGTYTCLAMGGNDRMRRELLGTGCHYPEWRTEPVDTRAAEGFQALANEADYFSVTCRFRRHSKSKKEGVKHTPWPQGMETFSRLFGNPPNYFAGAYEYVKQATGWESKVSHLVVVVILDERNPMLSTGLASDKYGHGQGRLWITWTCGEFALTVFHEIVHLFKSNPDWKYGLIGKDSNRRYEDWVEAQAVKLLVGV